MLKKFIQFLVETKKDTVVFTFGRFNPPSIGHGKLIDKVADLAKKNNAEARIYISNSQDAKKNPLPPKEKLKIMKKLFPGPKIILKSKIREPFGVVEHDLKGVKDAIFVVGSDRVSDFKSKLIPWALKNDITLIVVSAGDRDPDAEGAEGASGTKMREFAKNNDFKSFKKGLPKTDVKFAKKIFSLVQKNL